MSGNRAILIAGPTAGGKSAAALALAEALDGEIINADAMQVYADLKILTARPSDDDEARIPHHLYGVIDGSARSSAGLWAQMAAKAIGEIEARGRVPIIVGGTGLYFRALEEGLSPIPDVPASIRAIANERWSALGPEAFQKEVLARDPAMAHLPMGDKQRLIRAWEVYEATGAPLSAFQAAPRAPMLTGAAARFIIAPERALLYERCDARAQIMFESGAIDEVAALIARQLPADMPVLKAIGVAEIASFIAGEIDRDEALALMQQATRRFAKRQMTWFRNQTATWRHVCSTEEAVECINLF